MSELPERPWPIDQSELPALSASEQATEIAHNDTPDASSDSAHVIPFPVESDLSTAVSNMSGQTAEETGRHRLPDLADESSDAGAPEAIAEIVPIAIDNRRISLSGMKKYLNPIEAAKGYGRQVKKTIRKAGLADLAGTATAVGAGYYAYKMGGDAYLSAPMAFAAANGESLGFYGVMSFKEYRSELKKARKSGENIGHLKAFGRGVNNNIKDLGPSELVDTVTRPLSIMAAANMGFSDSTIGTLGELLTGKLIGDHPYFATMNASTFLQDHLKDTGRHHGFRNMSRLAIETVIGREFNAPWKPAKNLGQATS